MDDINYLVLLGRITRLENRIERLENEKAIQDAADDAQKLLKRFPFMMSKADVARALGVSRFTVYNMIKVGKLEINPVGKIPTRSVIDYIKKGPQKDV